MEIRRQCGSILDAVKAIKVVSLFWLLSILLNLSCRSSKPALADVSVGQQAYDKGDYASALKVFRPLAEQGNPDAQSWLGFISENGSGVPQNYTEAIKWYRLASQQHNSYAQDNLGHLYANGQGAPQDYKEAVKWYHLAADQGYSKGQYDLGVMYIEGQGVPQDYKEAAKWYRLAADQGYAEAQNVLSLQYSVGWGVPQDWKEAAKWERLAADQGYAEAQSSLGADYENGRGVPKDYILAHQWYNLASANGNVDATKNRDRIARKLTPVQLAEAQRLALEWKPPTAENLLAETPPSTDHDVSKSAGTSPQRVRTPVDYAAIAKKYGATISEATPNKSSVDYAASAKKYGLTISDAPPEAAAEVRTVTPGATFRPSERPKDTSARPSQIRNAVQVHSIQDAENKGLVRTSYRSLGGSSSGDSVILIVTKISDTGNLSLSIPAGLILRSPSASSQSMAVSDLKGRERSGGRYAPEELITLTDDKPVRYVIAAYCANFHKDNPPDGFYFQVAATPDPVLACILNESRKEKLSITGTQAAVWVRTDHVTFQEMNSRMAVGQDEWSKAETVASLCGSNQ